MAPSLPLLPTLCTLLTLTVLGHLRLLQSPLGEPFQHVRPISVLYHSELDSIADYVATPRGTGKRVPARRRQTKGPIDALFSIFASDCAVTACFLAKSLTKGWAESSSTENGQRVAGSAVPRNGSFWLSTPARRPHRLSCHGRMRTRVTPLRGPPSWSLCESYRTFVPGIQRVRLYATTRVATDSQFVAYRISSPVKSEIPSAYSSAGNLKSCACNPLDR
jgi:hypothetical protein